MTAGLKSWEAEVTENQLLSEGFGIGSEHRRIIVGVRVCLCMCVRESCVA